MKNYLLDMLNEWDGRRVEIIISSPNDFYAKMDIRSFRTKIVPGFSVFFGWSILVCRLLEEEDNMTILS